jgi:eukaryotic-like serine/threonine-protein kinase
VMVDWAGGRVTLTDFGLARLDDAARTRSALVPGSPGYMAPEMLAGAPPDARSDLYALGVLLFELLAGRRPHEAASLGELLQRVATDAAPDLRALRPDLPAPLADALARTLARRPAQRPADARTLAAELQAAAAILPATAAR